jgi:uncharacterized membrane protein YoaT (DUF817 family)
MLRPPDPFRIDEATVSIHINSIVRWTARVTAAAIALLFLMFVIGEPQGSLRSIAPRDWVAMVLLFGAMAAMVLACKWEFPAALISIFALAAFAAVVHINRYDVLLFLALPNLLFLLDWKLRRPHRPQHALQ